MDGHWYDRSGKRCGLVAGSKGLPVTPDIRHARKHGLLPGVTTILKAAARPALEVYRELQVLEAATQVVPAENEDKQSWINRVLSASRKRAEDAANSGSAIHYTIEQELRSGAPGALTARVLAVLQQLRPHNDRWETEVGGAHKDGFATQADLLYRCPESYPILIDIKTKDGNVSEQKLYDEHYMQLAATKEAMGLQLATCGILFISRDTADTHFAIAEPQQIDRGWSMFSHLLKYWQYKNNYDSSWQ